MKKLTFLFICAMCFMATNAQDIDILTQIDSAKTPAEMPILHLCLTRPLSANSTDLGIYVQNGKTRETQQIKQAGDCFTAYYPVYLKKDGTLTQAMGIHSHISTAPGVITDSTLLVVKQISRYISPEDEKIYRRWLEKYEKFGEKLFADEQTKLDNERIIEGTKHVAVVFSTKTNLPVKVYADITDCLEFMSRNTNKPYMYQHINLYYREKNDTTKWRPNGRMLQDDIYRPEFLTDEWLAKDSVIIVMQSNFDIADRAYTLPMAEDCKKYSDNFELKIYTVPYFYRDKRSYERIYQIKKKTFRY